MKNNKLPLLSSILLLFTIFFSCTSEKPVEDIANITDDDLFNEFSKMSGAPHYWGGDSDKIHEGNTGSPHGKFKVRYNQAVKNMLDDNGNLAQGISFPDGATLVKEAYTSDDKLDQLIIMQKASTDKNNGSGWLWTEYNSKNENIYSVSKKGNNCISCHSAGNRDLTRIFEFKDGSEPSGNGNGSSTGTTTENLSDDDIVRLATGGAQATIFYKGDENAYHTPMGSSPHNDKFKVRYNQIVADALDSNEKVPDGTVFSDGAMIIKETFNSDNTLKEWAVMYKASKDENKGEGWLWLKVDGSWETTYSSTQKGAACITCHKTGKGTDRDLTRIFEF